MNEIIENRCCKCAHCSSDLIYCKAKMIHVEPPETCALEELDLLMAEWSIPIGQRQRLLEWSNRRNANVLEFLVDTIEDIGRIEPAGPTATNEEWLGKYYDIQFVATAGLKSCALTRKRE